MNESQPPILEEKPTTNCFAKFAANFSVFVPLFALFVFFICVYGGIGLKIIAVIGWLPIPFISLGLILGIIALATSKQRKGIFAKAIIGILINGFLLLSLIALLFLLPRMTGHKFPQHRKAGWIRRPRN